MTLTEFLLARVEEDEAAANACLTKEALTPYSDDRIPPVKPEEWGDLVDNYLGGPMGKHCARHDPTRVIAECAAKRAVLDMHRPTVENVEWFDDATGTGTAPVCPSCRPKDQTDWNPPIGMAGVRPDGFIPSYTLAPCPTLSALAAVYAGHPDYRQEWAL